jgi:hypothetical protein
VVKRILLGVSCLAAATSESRGGGTRGVWSLIFHGENQGLTLIGCAKWPCGRNYFEKVTPQQLELEIRGVHFIHA